VQHDLSPPACLPELRLPRNACSRVSLGRPSLRVRAWARERVCNSLARVLCAQMLQELPTGARLATMTCYSCWKERKCTFSKVPSTGTLCKYTRALTFETLWRFPTAEFMSFLHSIAAHSPLLARLFANHASCAHEEAAVAGVPDRMHEVEVTGGSHGGGASQSEERAQAVSAPEEGGCSQPGGSVSALKGAQGETHSGGSEGGACGDSESGDGLVTDEVLLAPDAMMEPDAAPEESEIDRLQHERRLQEIERRRFQEEGGAGAGAGEEGQVKEEAEELSHCQKVSRYLSRTLKELTAVLPAEARKELAMSVHTYLQQHRAPDVFAAEINALVDRYSVVIPLKYKPQRWHSGQLQTWVSIDRKRTFATVD